MIASFKHKGVQAFYHNGSVEGIQAAHKERLRMVLIALHTAHQIEDMQIVGLKLQKLPGLLSGVWFLHLAVGWRITFRFDRGYVYSINYEKYES